MIVKEILFLIIQLKETSKKIVPLEKV
jgi:hypothetical protein